MVQRPARGLSVNQLVAQGAQQEQQEQQHPPQQQTLYQGAATCWGMTC